MRPARGIEESVLSELERLLRHTTRKDQLQRIQCVLLRARQGLTCEEVAGVVGWNPCWVRQVWSAFLRRGPEALISQARGGRRRANLSLREETNLVRRFEEKARAAGILVVSEIHAAYEQEVGRAVPKSTIYRVLARQGWRKVAPRPRHPKNDPEACEAFKKNSRRSSRGNVGGKRRSGGACG
jgi:transposase